MCPSGYFADYLKELSRVSMEINPLEFEDLVSELKSAYDRGSSIFICGNGGSASTAAHFTCDLKKMAAPENGKRFRIHCLNDNVPMMLAYANDMSYEDIFIEQVRGILAKDDLVIGISGSGNSENVLKALDYSNKNGARTFGICGFNGGRMKGIVKKRIVVRIDDMQKVEDLHMVVLHCALQYLVRGVAADRCRVPSETALWTR